MLFRMRTLKCTHKGTVPICLFLCPPCCLSWSILQYHAQHVDRSLPCRHLGEGARCTHVLMVSPMSVPMLALNSSRHHLISNYNGGMSCVSLLKPSGLF